MTITNDIKYVGVNDRSIDLFEGQYIVPEGKVFNFCPIPLFKNFSLLYQTYCKYALHTRINKIPHFDYKV